MNEVVYLDLPAPNKDDVRTSTDKLREKFRFIIEDGLAWYETQALQIFSRKSFPDSLSENLYELIQQTIFNSVKDKKEKEEKQRQCTYYVANSVAFIRTLRQLLTEDFIDKYKYPEVTYLTNYNYYRVIHNLLVDSLVLLNDCATLCQGGDAPYAVYKSPCQHTLTIYHSIKRAIFGQSTYHAMIEVEPDLAISLIRQLIELRVRRGFGILGWQNKESGYFEPLPMSKIFTVLTKYKHAINLSIPLEALQRIHDWSNIFLHSGEKDYSWKPLLVTEYLKPFVLGKNGNVDYGISVSRECLNNIRMTLEADRGKFEILTCEPASYVSQERLYEVDFYAWTQEQSRLLHTQQWSLLDRQNLIEEIESLGRQQRRELRNRLAILLGNLLKWHYQSDRRSHSWLATLRVQRRDIKSLLKDNPSLKPYLEQALQESYLNGRDLAMGETNLPLSTFPETCAYDWTDILDMNFYPGLPSGLTDLTDEETD